jgi:hypothetical protein
VPLIERPPDELNAKIEGPSPGVSIEASVQLAINKTRQVNWFDLLKLVRECPAIVNGVRITETTRLALWTLAMHTDGKMNTARVTLEPPFNYQLIGRSRSRDGGEIQLSSWARSPTVAQYHYRFKLAGHEHINRAPPIRYLTRTHTNEGDLVLDNCAGSGTTVPQDCLEKLFPRPMG